MNTDNCELSDLEAACPITGKIRKFRNHNLMDRISISSITIMVKYNTYDVKLWTSANNLFTNEFAILGRIYKKIDMPKENTVTVNCGVAS